MSWPNVYATLAASSEVAAIVGDRIGAHGFLSTTESRPFVTWQTVGVEPFNVLEGGAPSGDKWAIQIDCHAADETVLRELVFAVRTAIQSAGYVTGCSDGGRDSSTGLYSYSWSVDLIN